jgi:hypothetical protein
VCPRRTLTTASVAAAASQLPSLTALDVCSTSDMADPGLEWPITGGFARLRELTLPAAFMPRSTACLSWLTGLTGLSKLCFETDPEGPDVDVLQVASLAARLPALVALELEGDLEEVARLRSLTRLTALKLGGQVTEEGVTTGQLLHHVGTLTNLRSLALEPLWWNEDGDSGEPGWLSQLHLLTSLRACFGYGGVGLEETALSVPHLPALCELRLSSILCDDDDVLSVAACAHIAAARSTLRLLHLDALLLPASLGAEVMPQLTGLTCLCLACIQLPIMPLTWFTWLTVLTALRELGYSNNHGSALPCELLAGVSNVDTLSLSGCSFVNAPYMEQLCEAMPQLTNLDLSGNRNLGAGLSSLQHLTNLEVLGLAVGRGSLVLLQHVRAPSSLRRCCLGGDWQLGAS